MNNPILDQACSDLVQKYHCHTAILYGSRSRGDWTDESDYDLVGFKDNGEKFRDARVIEGNFLDAFIYPVGEVVGNEKDLLRIRQGKVLFEKDQFGSKLLEKLDQIFAEGPKPLPESELNVIRVWIEKMLQRISKKEIFKGTIDEHGFSTT